MDDKRPGQTPQRRPPTPRYPPPRTQNNMRPRSYLPQSPPYPPPSRPYPPPQMTPPRRTSPQASQLRKAPQTSQPRTTTQARKPATATLRKAEPEPRFRDVLWPQSRETPVENRVAFLCALLYALIHTLCGVLSIYPLNLLTARMPSPLSALVRALFPGLIGSVLCALTRYPMRLENRVGLLAYRKLLRMLLTLLVGVTLLMWGEWQALKQAARFVAMFVAGPLVAGTGLSVLLLYMDWLYDLEENDEDA